MAGARSVGAGFHHKVGVRDRIACQPDPAPPARADFFRQLQDRIHVARERDADDHAHVCLFDVDHRLPDGIPRARSVLLCCCNSQPVNPSGGREIL
eukprot:197226-Rhodomonas_salina.1